MRRFGLRTTFAITLAGIALGIGLLVDHFAGQHARAALLHMLQRDAEVYANTIVRQCNLADSKREIERLLYAVSSNRDVGLILVTGPNDRILGSSVRQLLGQHACAIDEPLLASTLATSAFRLDDDRAAFEAVLPVRWSNLNLPELRAADGRLFIRLDAHAATSRVRANQRQLLLVIAAVAGLGLAGFLAITRHHVLAPLRQLRQAMENWRTGTRGVRIGAMPNADLHAISTSLQDLFDSLETSEQMQRAIIDAAADAIVTIGSQGTIRQWNPAAEVMFGIRAADAIGSNVSRIVPPPHDKAHEGYIRRYLETGVARLLGFPREVMAVTANGTQIPVGLSINEARVGNERLFVGILRDMSDERATRRELLAAKEAADAAAAAKATFLANMSHEIRTPLTAILGFAEELDRVDRSPAAIAEATEIIRRNGEHLLTIINDILDLSKLEAGKVQIERIPARVDAIAMDVIRMMQARAKNKGLALDLCIASALPESVLTDPTRIRQILINLVGNAIKFTPSGSVVVTLEALFAEERMQISVVDTGIGIPSGKLDALFGAFEQADASTTRRFGGTGLGLNISKRLARMLGGDLVAESLDGSGSRFLLTFPTGPMKPAATGDRAAGVEMRPRTAVPKLRGRVLVADDGLDNQRLLGRVLTAAGLEVTSAHDGTQAVAAVCDAEPPIDLVLMDLQMPVMDGYAATKTLRDMGVAIPIVAVSANVMPEDRARAIAAGCTHFAAKPVDRAALYSILQSALAKPASPASPA